MNDREILEELTRGLPRAVVRVMLQEPEGELREVRIRAGRCTVLHTASGIKQCYHEPTPQQVQQIAEALCEHALYARAEEQRNGFVTLRGGHRMGLCGRVLLQGQSVRALREISSLCIRVAGQRPGAADRLMPHLLDDCGKPRNTLLISSPGMGKTTMLRDTVRQLSSAGFQVGVVDERSEIAAVSGGMPQLDVGPHTDVLDGCAKEAGLRWMLRGMSPDVLATDELGTPGDVQAVLECTAAGVRVVSTLHGRQLEPRPTRGALCHLALHRAFERYVLLDERIVGRIAAVYDADLRPLEEAL